MVGGGECFVLFAGDDTGRVLSMHVCRSDAERDIKIAKIKKRIIVLQVCVCVHVRVSPSTCLPFCTAEQELGAL